MAKKLPKATFPQRFYHENELAGCGGFCIWAPWNQYHDFFALKQFGQLLLSEI